jgi:hypothetical protein
MTRALTRPLGQRRQLAASLLGAEIAATAPAAA